MANKHRCGCSGRDDRNSNRSYGCLNSLESRYRWDNYPYYGGPCPDVNGAANDGDCDRDEHRGRRRRHCGRRNGFGMFSAMLPMAVAANGVIPLVGSCGCPGWENFNVNSGLVTVKEEGTYLATYTVRLPEGADVNSTITLNVNDASQSSAITQVGGAGPGCFTAQAIFDACGDTTVTLRSSEAINITEPSAQPLFTLSLVRLEEE
ncbi:MAG: hypothetical protein Q4C10_06790 [Clostridia bacterium]|nr:hypothetical protein [Clostridia bacterium]